MVLKFETLKARVARLDAEFREECVAHVRARYQLWLSGAISIETLSADAGAALNRYARTTLNNWMDREVPPRSQEQQQWLAHEYPEAVGITATAIRDVIAEHAARHAVAQVLQTGVLLAQTELFDALDLPKTVNRRR